MKTIPAFVVIVLVSSLFLSGCGTKEDVDKNLNLPGASQLTKSVSPTGQVQEIVKQNTDTLIGIKTKDGQMVIKLYSDIAPKTVKNFLDKANSGFYDNLTFHRVIDGFMAQGGDPTGTGTGGGQIKSELNNITFKKGSLGLARTPVSKEISNDSQFFICFDDEGCRHLTGDYVNFGEVISGFDVLEKIKQGDKMLEVNSYTK